MKNSERYDFKVGLDLILASCIVKDEDFMGNVTVFRWGGIVKLYNIACFKGTETQFYHRSVIKT